MTMHALVITVDGEDRDYGGNDVYLGEIKIGHRPYDGSWKEDIAKEAAASLAALLRERLGWPLEAPDED
jgi:hypothetical protein